MMKPTTVYIIDDDADDRAFLIEALQNLYPALECFTATNGQEGVKKLETGAVPRPSLLFLDLNMPRMNGRQVLARLKSNPDLKAIPVIVYSTSANPKDAAELKALGATDYIVKQHEDSLLKAEIQKLFQAAQP